MVLKFKVKVTAKSSVGVSSCGGRRRPRRRLDIKLSSSLTRKLGGPALTCGKHRNI